MTTYRAQVRTPLSAEQAFGYLADFANVASWDPGVRSAEQVAGSGPGVGAEYEVGVDSLKGELTLRYTIVEYVDRERFAVRAESRMLMSYDVVTVEATDTGALVTYEAELALNGPLGIADPFLAPFFDRIGDKAAAGLATALDGELVATVGKNGAAADSGVVANLVDKIVETPIVPSFTRVGYDVRKRLESWTSLDGYDLEGKVVVVTGATSGLGRAAATQLARCGATLILVGRSEQRNTKVVDEIVAETGNRSISEVAADMGDYDQVRALAARVLADHDRLDVLIHNAGALSVERSEVADGTEATVASQVVGPFLLTSLLLDRLSASGSGRVITMSSGGMYAAALSVDKLEMAPADYNGTEQYARAKRAQATLNEMWARRFPDLDIVFHAVHPGWADTPGVDAALPTFAAIMGPLLRTPEQGADTLVWLAADPNPLTSSGVFWHDRRPRSIHKLPTTRRTDTPERRERLWRWVTERSGL